jgi:hypothetical protein
MSTASTVLRSTIMRVEKSVMLNLLHREPEFAERFLGYLLSRNIRMEADLVDHLFNSSEKRLARLLLLLANFGQESKPIEDASRGQALFAGKAKCATCHVPPLYTEPGSSLHTPEEIGIDDFQSSRSPTKQYRTTPLRGLWSHQKGGFYHDGRFQTLDDVVNHYDQHLTLGLSEQEKKDLVEFLKSL